MSDETPAKPPLKPRRGGDRRLTPRTGPGLALWYVLGLVLLIAVGQAFYYSVQPGQTISYSEFKQAVRDGRVAEVTVADDRVTGTLTAAAGGKRNFTAIRIEDPKLLEDLERHSVKYTGVIAS